MKRTTIFLEEPLERDLKARAEREGRPMAALVREALREYMAAEAVPRPRFVGAGRSGHRDTAERHEALLFQPEPAATEIETEAATEAAREAGRTGAGERPRGRRR
ncbi:MAG: ribbon-helix-helix domain-containing protein [Acidobacteriota bacterium]|nr:ribbon-helix-helix domain-containing protein [Acidobacteriota bacterium]MDH3523754.1 ribbon-helix-helix domain-containing protein [Acidobacteriota bacterium]